MIRYKGGIVAVAFLALCALVTTCGEKERAHKNHLCTIGSDTLTPGRVNRLVPDSLSPSQKIARAALELTLIACVRTETPKRLDSVSAKRIGKELADQLSRQTSDSWTIEAARYLYDAVKITRFLYVQLHSWAAVAACIDSLAEKTIMCNDSAVKRDIITIIMRPFACSAYPNSEESLESLVSQLFSLPSPSAHVACEFAATAELPTAATSAAQTMVKGLVFDSTRHGKGPLNKIRQPVITAATAAKDTTQAALRARSQSSIKDSIEKHIPDLEALYKRYLKMHQNMAGTVVVTFQIQYDGAVASARIKTSKITEKDFLVQLHNYFLKKVHFKPIPEKLGTMEVEFPFEFAPEN